MTVRSIRRRVAWLVNYEPTWFPEFGCTLAAFLWSAACFLTDDMTIHGSAWIVPAIGVAMGPVRWALLFRLWHAPRVAAAFVSGTWWSWIFCGLAQKYGVIPGLGLLIGFFALDVLTLARFSMPCARDLLAEVRRRRGR